MEEKIIDSGIDILGKISWGTHFCQFYKTKEDLIEILVPYFKAGLEDNEFCMWVTSEPFNEKEVKAAIRKAIPDFEKYLKKGQLEILPYSQWYIRDGSFNPQKVLDGWIDKLNKAFTLGFKGLRLTGNTFWLEQTLWKSFAEYENTINEIIGNYKMIAICTYSLEKCGAEEILDVMNTHQFALIKREEKWTIIESAQLKQTRHALQQEIAERKQNEAAIKELSRDITEKKKQEQEIKLISTYNRSLIESSLDPLVTIGPNGTITDVNKATERATGLSRKRLVGTDFSDYFTDPEKAKAGYQKVFEQGTVVDYELELRHLNGYTTPVMYNASVFRNEMGAIVGVFAAARDISAQKKAEQEIKLANAYNRSLIESSLDPLVTIGPGGAITDVNKATEYATGLSRKQLVGTDFSDYFTDPEKAKAGYQKVFEQGTVVDYELELRHINGNTTPVMYNASVFRNEVGETVGVFAAARDITERNQILNLERSKLRRFKNLIDQSNDAIFIVDPDTSIILEVNKGASRILEYTQEELLQMKIIDIEIEFKNIIEWKNYIKKLRSIGELIQEKEYKTKSGKSIFVEISIKLILEKEKDYLIKIFRDITDRKQAQLEIIKKNEIFSAINEIFKIALVTDIEEIFTRKCLEMLQNLTKSKFGFIGELNKNGRLDDIAISNPGWDACKMSKSEATLLIKNIELRGIWSIVLKDEKSYIINEPKSHPASADVPKDHPPITAFIGVPLKQAGKTIGMIGLVNKEGGYNQGDLDIIEALSVAFVEALMRKRAELNVEKLQKRLNSILANLKDPVIVISHDYENLFVNQNAQDLFGNQLVGKKCYEIIKGKNQPCENCPMQKLFSSEICNVRLDQEITVQPTRETKIFNINCSKIENYDGNLVLIESLRDITHEKEIQQKLTESKKNLKNTNLELGQKLEELKVLNEHLNYHSLLLDTTSDAIFSTDSDLNIISWNKGAEKMLGWTEKEAISKNSGVLLKPRYSKPRDQIIKELRENGFWKGEGVLKKKDGSDVYFLTTSTVFYDTGAKKEKIVAIVKDISEIKEAQKEIADLAKFPAENPNAVLRVDQNKVLYSNLPGKNIFNIEAGDPIPNILIGPVKSVLKDWEIHIEDLEINDKTFTLTIIPIKSSNYINIYAVDITLRKQAEKRMKNFVSTASHELRTPLTVFIQSIEILKNYASKLSNGQKEELINDLQQNAKNLSELVEELLILSRYDENKASFKKKDFFILESFQNAVNLMLTKYSSKNIKVSIAADKNIQLLGDKNRMEELIRIFLDNAFKYSLPNSKINLSAIQDYRGKYNPNNIKGVLIKIEDFGIGIPKEDIPHLFDRFFRSKNVKDQSGSGLGLSIAKEIINMFKGEVIVESELNNGTTFFLFFPV